MKYNAIYWKEHKDTDALTQKYGENAELAKRSRDSFKVPTNKPSSSEHSFNHLLNTSFIVPQPRWKPINIDLL